MPIYTSICTCPAGSATSSKNGVTDERQWLWHHDNFTKQHRRPSCATTFNTCDRGSNKVYRLSIEVSQFFSFCTILYLP